MRQINLLSLIAAASLLLTHPVVPLAGTSDLSAEEAFQQAVELIEDGKHEEAISLLEHSLSEYPDAPSVLWNLGTSAILTERYGLAAKVWERYRAVEVDDWQVLPKLVQTYQGLGELGRRDSVRKRLLELYDVGKFASLSERKQFCREQYTLGDGRVLVYEYFAPLSTDWAKFFEYVVIGKDQKVKFSVSMGSYNATNSIDLESGNHKPNERLYHFDAYYPDGVHSTLGFYVAEAPMPYEKAREIMMKSVDKINNLKASGGTQ